MNQLAKLLSDNDLAALWHHPFQSLLLVAYPTASNTWRILDDVYPIASEASLRVMARHSIPSIQTFIQQEPQLSQQPQPSRPSPHIDSPDTSAAVENIDPLTSLDPPAPTQMDLDPPNMNIDSVLSATTDLDTVFRKNFGISFARLIAKKDKQSTNIFYLLFPFSARPECDLIVRYLEAHNAVIYSNRLQEDWERFARTVTAGVILVRWKLFRHKTHILSTLLIFKFH